MSKVKGLGRGLDALLGEKAQTQSTSRMLGISQLQPGIYQPRTRMDEDSLMELSQSIKSQGILQPILVRKIDHDRYEIIAGERRWRAAQRAGLMDVPVIVKDIPNETALAVSLIENIQREDLNPLEEAQGIERLIREFNLTHEQAAGVVGRSRVAVSNLLRLTALNPGVQELLLQNALEMGHARALLSLADSQQKPMALQVIAGKWTVRQTEKAVMKKLQGDGKKTSVPYDADQKMLEEELSEKMGSLVEIHQKKGGRGSLIINYGSLDQLEGIISLLRKQ
jgi:ParB family chromosome partitioning protein